MVHNFYFVDTLEKQLAIDILKDGIDGGLFESLEKTIKKTFNIDAKIIADKSYNKPQNLLQALENDETGYILFYNGRNTNVLIDKKEIEAVKLLAKNNPDDDMWTLMLQAQLVKFS